MTLNSNGKTPAQTIDDLSTAMMADGVANQARARNDAANDRQRYRARMNAVSDAQAKQFGATVSEPKGEDEVNVFTNSPITHPAPIVVSPPSNTSPAWIIVAILGTLLLVFLLWQMLSASTQAPVTPPVTPPAASGWKLDVSVSDSTKPQAKR